MTAYACSQCGWVHPYRLAELACWRVNGLPPVKAWRRTTYRAEVEAAQVAGPAVFALELEMARARGTVWDAHD